MGNVTISFASYPEVNIVAEFSTRSETGAQTNLSELFRRRAPGSSPASHATWKPLQMARIGAPRSACARTSVMMGLNRAMAPARR